ncbi:PIN domain-containing protein [Mycobacterium sp. JS623]|uniref:PIN domain-containing protein n=1 Tax=Mycobacterium sp. JS623 TaxID=212767 RepID=UPI002FFB93ED
MHAVPDERNVFPLATSLCAQTFKCRQALIVDHQPLVRILQGRQQALAPVELAAAAQETLAPLAAVHSVATALLRVHLAETGRRVRINDLWIAAIAVSKHLPVVTQDDDFDALEGVADLSIIHV